MNWVRLRKIEVQNFRGFQGTHELPLPESGLVGIKGLNHETNGASGAGKTGIPLAIAYAFRLCPFSAKSLQNWNTEEPMSVRVVMDTSQGSAVLERGKELSLTVDGVLVRGAAKAVEARLDELTGVGPSLREVLTYRDQKHPQNILAMSDSELKKFLTQVLGLEELEAEIEVSTKRLKALETDVAVVTAKHQDATRLVLEQIVGDKPELPDDRLQETLVAAQKALSIACDAEKRAAGAVRAAKEECAKKTEALAAEFAATRSALVQKLSDIKLHPSKTPQHQELVDAVIECGKHLTRIREADASARFAHTQDVRSLEDQIKELVRRIATKPQVLARYSKLKQELASLQGNKCPTCSQTWAETQTAIAKNEVETVGVLNLLESEIPLWEAELTKLKSELAAKTFTPNPRLAQFEAVAKSLDERLRVCENEALVAVHKEAAVYETQLAQVRSKWSEKTELLKRPAAEAEYEYQSARLACATIRVQEAEASAAAAAAITKYEHELATYKAAVARMDAATAAAAKAADEVAQKTRALSEEHDYLDLIRGFRNKVFDEVLAAIGEEASSILSELPNARHVAVEFRSERETGSGNIEYKIKPMVTIYGVERELDAATSGGQHTSIALAVDLAVIKVVSARMGTNLQWLVLDESFNGHDVVTKTSCLELLQAYAKDKLVLIVDHATEVKEMFSQQIVVEYDKEKSWFGSVK